MRLNIQTTQSESIDLYVNGRLEGTVGIKTRDTNFECRDELANSIVTTRVTINAARMMCWMAQKMKSVPKQGRASFVEGFSDGYDKKTVPHPTGPAVPPTTPKHDQFYVDGYEFGESFHRLAKLLDDGIGGRLDDGAWMELDELVVA